MDLTKSKILSKDKIFIDTMTGSHRINAKLFNLF